MGAKTLIKKIPLKGVAVMKKKVLIFSLAYYPRFHGGAEPAIKEITDRIDPDEIEFHLITTHFDTTLPHDEKIGNVNVHRIGIGTKNPSFEDLGKMPLHLNKFLFQFWATIKAIQLHRKDNFDAIWAMMAHSAGVPAVLFKIIHPKVPYLLTLQEGDPPEHVEKVLRPVWPLFTRSFTKADVVQVISSFLGEWARRRNVPEEKIKLIYNGANPQSFKPKYTEADVKEIKAKLGKKQGDVYLMNASRLVHQKANDDTVRALALLPEHISLVLIGEGEDEEMLRNLAQELGVSRRVHFIGRIERTEVPKYRNREIADIYVTPSRSEGLQLSSLSALAARVPLIATQEGGLSEYVFGSDDVRGQTAWVVKKDSPEDIARAVKEILNNPDTVEEVVERSYKMVYEKYNWDNIAVQMQNEVFSKLFKT